MTDRPACTQCDAFKLRIDKGAKGWEAYCTATNSRGRLIAWQYGTKLTWTKNELIDKLNTKICPGWCPKWEKGEKA